MSSDDGDRKPAGPPTPPAGARRRYERPRIISREPLEAMAAVCTPGIGKTSRTSCPNKPIAS